MKKIDQFQKINNKLASQLKKKYPQMFKEVLEQKNCDIDETFLGFVDTYYYLSKIIPKDWTVVDFGCAFAAQAYYFIRHKAFIGVDIGNKKRFHFKNTEFYEGTIADSLKQKPFTKKVFAICNNVPSLETTLVRNYYPNCYIFYTA